MSATFDERKTALNETQRSWLQRMADALQLRVTDGTVQSRASQEPGEFMSGTAGFQAALPAGNALAGFPNATPKTTPPQPVPLYDRKDKPQPAPPLQKKPPTPPQPPQPIVYTRTAQIDKTDQDKRQDKLALTGLKTQADVAKFAETKRTVRDETNKRTGTRTWQGYTAAKLGEMSGILRAADRTGSMNVPTFVPTEDETNKIREKYANLNDALSNGKYEEAAKISRDLGLPISLEMIDREVWRPRDEKTVFTDEQWKTLFALGQANLNVTRKEENGRPKYNWDTNPTMQQVPNLELNALNGAAAYAQLVDDMASNGVKPLSAPPGQDQMQMYMDNVRAKAERKAQIDFPGKPDDQKRALSDALLAANQRLMDGMQVHYRGAGDKDPVYGPTKMSQTFLFRKGKQVLDSNGKPLKLELPSTLKESDRIKQTNDWVKANGGGEFYYHQAQTPEGYDDNTSRDVYGNRHESDCEGMASFRLRTLPPDFKRLGVVSGRLKKGGEGHLVAVFQSPDGRVYLSSNGKAPILVKPRGQNVSGDDIRWAVVAEFDAIYLDEQTESDFSFGLGTALPPASFTGSQLDVANKSTDQVLQDASNDDVLRSNQGRPNAMPPLDWGRLAP